MSLSKANTKAQRRRDAWDKRLADNGGSIPGGKEKASWHSVLLFNWIGPLVQLAYARPLEPEHLFQLPATSKSERLTVRFNEAWNEQLARPEGQRSLAKALVKVFRTVLIVSGLMALAQQVVLLATPLVVQRLLRWFIRDTEDTWVGVLWALALFLVGFLGNGLLGNHYFLVLYVMGMDARSTLNAITYTKALRLSNKARQTTSTGELVTLMSNDAQRLPDMALSIHAIWSTPLFVALTIFFLVRLVGASAVAGIVFLVAMIPIQGRLAMRQMRLQRAQMQQTTSRVKVINEVLQGIRIVKYYAWEGPFLERITALREKEVAKIKSFAFVNAYSMSIMLTTPFVMVMLTLIVYANGSGDFTPDVVFTAVSLLLVIRFPLMMLPMSIAGWVQGKVSLGRMQKFFELEELQPSDREWTNRTGNGKGAGSLSASGTFVWTPDVAGEEGEEEEASPEGEGGEEGDAKKPKMAAVSGSSASEKDAVSNAIAGADGIGGSDEGEGTPKSEVKAWDLCLEDLKIPAGKLVAVVGQVGSGKSSLVSALLGEMTKVEGNVSVDGSVAYVAQTAWIVNASLKDNILMGRPFDEKRYEDILDVCDMRQDLSQLPAGDSTEIGEKGINLSGGQKQRVSIARAAYANADVYILDDPLSAVDAHVGRHLFDACLAGFLKGKTIVLCANQLQFLSQTDLVLVLSEGRIVEQGSYGELIMTEGSELARLMEDFAEDNSDMDDGDAEEAALAADGSQERKEGEESVRFGSAMDIPPVATPSSRPPSGRAGSRRGSRSYSGVSAGSLLSMDSWARSVREASDTTAAMMEGWAGSSPVPSMSATIPDADSGGGQRGGEEKGGTGDDGETSTGIVGRAARRRRSRTTSNRSSASNRRVSNTSRQHSDGGRHSSVGEDGERAKKSASTLAQEALAQEGALQTAEGREEGAVALRVFRIYFKDGSGGWFLPVVLVIVSILTQACSNVFDLWLSFWSDKALEDGETDVWYQYVYGALCVTLVTLYLCRALLFAWQSVKSSKHLHAVLSKGVMRAPVSFFDTTPIGRVLNRFTKDMDSIDLLLPRNVPQFVATLSVLIGVMITIAAVLPWFIIVIIPIMFLYYKVQMYYRPVNRDLQRLESVSRSPIFAQFSETLNGVSTLRAYNQQDDFINRNSARLDDSATAFYHMHVSNRWLGIRLEAMGTTMNLAAALLIVFSRDGGWMSIKGGIAGLVLTYTQQVTGYLTWTVRMGCETEARITAVERAQEYADLHPEAPPIVDDYRPPTGWPATGALKLQGIEMRYRPGLDLVLKGVNLDVKGGERIGIAGRTGSGKSSLMVALFRIVEPCGGSITIDGIDALRVGLDDLREAISIIPQDPVMFCGTMRENLDPFGRYDDVTIWSALEAARLSQYVSGLEGKLEAEVSEGGENLSLGQRQLVCLARAVLRRNKILVMDEATANVDVDTDTLIQEAIRKEFAGCTVLTIAHRLNTIMDSDRILVMQNGKVGEFDTPANLVSNARSLLMGFIRQTGAGSSRRLVGIANGGNNAFDHNSNTATTESSTGSPTSSPGTGGGPSGGLPPPVHSEATALTRPPRVPGPRGMLVDPLIDPGSSGAVSGVATPAFEEVRSEGRNSTGSFSDSSPRPTE